MWPLDMARYTSPLHGRKVLAYLYFIRSHSLYFSMAFLVLRQDTYPSPKTISKSTMNRNSAGIVTIITSNQLYDQIESECWLSSSFFFFILMAMASRKVSKAMSYTISANNAATRINATSPGTVIPVTIIRNRTTTLISATSTNKIFIRVMLADARIQNQPHSTRTHSLMRKL